MPSLFLELNDKQVEAVKATKGPVLVLAGAGSGKTKTLTHRLAYLIQEQGLPPHSVLAVTFTNKAAGEIRNRAAGILRQSPRTWQTWRGFGTAPALGTFHSVCARILRQDGGRLGFKREFAIFDNDDQKRAMKQVMLREAVSNKETNPNAVLALISRAKNELAAPADFARRARGPFEKLAARLYENYQEYLKENQAMDFDDLLMNTVALWQKFPEVLSEYQARWPYIMIDEYQDTNHAQYVWARLLAGEKKNIFVVGDDWQGIYSWRGATIRNILEFGKDYPGAKIIRLEQNYRSPQEIVELGNVIIAGNRGQMKKKLWTERQSGVLPEVWQVSDETAEAEKVLEKIWEEEQGKSKKEKVKNNEDGIMSDDLVYDYEAEEGGGILDKILGGWSKKKPRQSASPAHLRRGLPFDLGKQPINWNKYAVLYRTNAQSRAFEESCLKYGAPYRLIGGIRFYERKEIKDCIAYLRLLLNPEDAVSLGRIINAPARGIGHKTLSKLAQIASERRESLLLVMSSADEIEGLSRERAQAAKNFAAVFSRAQSGLAKITVSETIDLLLARAGYYDYLKNLGEAGEERLANINELKTVAKKFSALRGQEALMAFLEDVALVADVDNYQPETGQALTLMTLHSAKGLEFDVVFLVGMEEGLLPHASSIMEPSELEEERRLCYVGITRARERLYFIFTRGRTLYGSSAFAVPSRFLAELGEERVRYFSEEER